LKTFLKQNQKPPLFRAKPEKQRFVFLSAKAELKPCFIVKAVET
jgi:hypothetical protein